MRQKDGKSAKRASGAIFYHEFLLGSIYAWKNYPPPKIIAPPSPQIRPLALIVGEADNWASWRIRGGCCALSHIRRIQRITLKIRQNLNTGRTVLVLIFKETSGHCLSPSIYDQGPNFAFFGSFSAAETGHCSRITLVNFKNSSKA